jgi:hypothetical protein
VSSSTWFSKRRQNPADVPAAVASTSQPGATIMDECAALLVSYGVQF